MRRTVICILCCLFMYGCYMYTLPETENASSAVQAAAQIRIPAKITLPAIRLYAVSLGSFDTETEALPYAAAYALRGAAGHVVETETGWEILGVGCDSDSDAERICRQLSENENIPARTVLFTADETVISLTAAQSQTDAIANALELMESIPAELSQLAAQIDSGKCPSETARTLISTRYTEAGRVLETLSAELGTTADIFCRMTETGLMELEEKLQIMSSKDAPGGLVLSSLMKQCSLETTLYMINMMNTLSR